MPSSARVRDDGQDQYETACDYEVARLRRSFTGNLRVVGKVFGTLRQFQGRIEATTYEQAWHYPFSESLVAPTGFALEGLRYAKRVYEKTARRRGRDARQELHNAEWAAAPQRGAPVSAHPGTPGRDEGGGVGCKQRRSQ